MSEVQFKRGDTNTLNNTPTTDGLIYFNTEELAIYMDNGDDRLKYKTIKSLTDRIENNNMNVPTCQACNTILIPYTQVKNTPINQTDGHYIPTHSVLQNIIGNDSLSHGTIMNSIDYLKNHKTLFNLVHTFDITQPISTYEFDIDDVNMKFLIMVWKNSARIWTQIHRINTRQCYIDGNGSFNSSNSVGYGYYNSYQNNNHITINFTNCTPYQIYTT